MAGRKRKPTSMHLVQGTFRPDRHGDEPDFGRADIQPFPDMGDHAVRIWRREIGPLLDTSVMQQTDRLAFRILCESVAEYEQAVTEIARVGHMVKGTKGFAVRNPWIAVRNQAVQRIQQYSADFGLTPAARARLTGFGGGSGAPRGFDLD